MASYRGRNVTLSFSTDNGQTWERLNSEAVEIQISVDRASLQRLDETAVQFVITSLRDRANWYPVFASFSDLAAATVPLAGAMVEFGRAAIEAASEAEREYQRLRQAELEQRVRHRQLIDYSRYERHGEPGRISLDDPDEAENRARDLLLSCLTPAQQEEYTATRSFTVKVKSGNRYRIEQHRNYNVIRLDKKGQVVSELCAGPVEEVPLEDQMLAQKLLLETDEAEFLAVANRRSVGAYPSFNGIFP